MDTTAKAIAVFIKERGVPLTAIAKNTGIPYNALQPSLTGRRNLKASEYLILCDYLKEDPMKFFIPPPPERSR